MPARKPTLLPAACVALLAALLTAVAARAAGQPRAVAVEPIKEAGRVWKGEKIVHDFLIRNDGDAVLEITEVRAACGCTTTGHDRTIAPGQTGKVRAVVDTTTFNGPIAKGVTVFTNDSEAPQIELTVRARVETHLAVKPGYARYIAVQGESGSVVQTLWANDSAALAVTGVESPLPFLRVTWREATPEERVPDAGGRQWRIEMRLAGDAPVGALSDYVTVRTDHPKQQVVQIPVSGFVRPRPVEP